MRQAACGIGALADDTRRELYLLVCAAPAPVNRDQAAEALGIARHQAKFHLDRLEDEGLLVSEYARTSGKTGPGAGRPAKHYRRADTEFALSLPGRQYALAGRIMAEAIATSTRTGEPVADVLDAIAAREGREMGERARADHGTPTDGAQARGLAVRTLAERGYEPCDAGGATHLRNCPFHALVAEHPELVCRMNHALIGGLAEALPHCAPPRLEPGEGRCCVLLPPGGAATARSPRSPS